MARLSWDHFFLMQTNQSRIYSPNHLLTESTHQYSSALNARVSQQAIRDHGLSPTQGELFRMVNPELLTLPQ